MARPVQELARPVSLATNTAKPARPVPLVPAAPNASLDDSATASDAIVPINFEVSHNNKEDKLVDHEVSLVRLESDMDYSSSNYYFVGNDEKIAQFGFVPQIAIF